MSPNLYGEKNDAYEEDNNDDPVFVVSITDGSGKSGDAGNAVIPYRHEQKGWKRNQYLASLAANFGSFAFGTFFGWSATSLPYLRTDTQVAVTSLAQESWISSLMLIGALVAGPPSGYLNERIGRRMTMLLLTAPCLAGWALIYFAINVEMIYAGRFLTGFVGGAFTIVAPVYVAETSDPDIRGKLSAGFDMGIAAGILYVEVIGAYASWKWQTLASAALTVVGHLLLMIVPESPRYLVSKEKFDEARKSLCWLKNTTDSELVENELNELKTAAAEQKVKDDESTSWTDMFQPHILKPCSVTLMIHLFSSISGNIAITAFTVDIFISAGTELDEFLCTVIFGITDFLSAFLAALVVDECGRRPLLMISQFVMALSLGGTGAFYFLKEANNGIAPPGLDWLPVTSLGIFIAAFALGTGPVSYMVQGEILPPEAKGVASSVITIVKWATAFLTTRFFLDILSFFGDAGGYWLFAAFSLVGFFYIIFCVPETKGKTLEEIQKEYYSKK